MTDDDRADVPRFDAALAGGFVLGVVTALVLVLTWGLLTGNDDPGPVQAGAARGSDAPDSRLPGSLGSLGPTTDSGVTDDPDGASTSSSTQADESTLERCASAARTLSQALDAAGPALAQWRVHVDAMNQLVVGEITLQQATEFWNRTRVGAQRKVAGFRETFAQVRREGVDCPDPDLMAPGSSALPACARQVAAEAEVLRAARTSIDTWARHIKEMDMLRLGDLSPEQATRMWLSMWHQGARDLETYRTAERRAHALQGCEDVVAP